LNKTSTDPTSIFDDRGFTSTIVATGECPQELTMCSQSLNR
jgi:hypothetical protein